MGFRGFRGFTLSVIGFRFDYKRRGERALLTSPRSQKRPKLSTSEVPKSYLTASSTCEEVRWDPFVGTKQHQNRIAPNNSILEFSLRERLVVDKSIFVFLFLKF